MNTFDITIAVPTEDRRRAYTFARALGFETPGELAEDGVPEPLQVVVNERARVMYIPTGGFGWVTADRATAAQGTVECLLSVTVDSTVAVDELVRTAVEAGASVATQPGQQQWGYTGTIADPDGHLWEIVHPAD
ncbi:VOC family protein [Actinomadura sp. 7K507]|uniref:VOC family protein n=1 Tax=Actinomadura sp. 7K507 TaxID=2530365 RepID=UPI00105284F1|nr:VOC family protein [Actinomadura sp. 7K507]TDC89944.1 VOC family protein [Actinomadura sp. 7K507]